MVYHASTGNVISIYKVLQIGISQASGYRQPRKSALNFHKIHPEVFG